MNFEQELADLKKRYEEEEARKLEALKPKPVVQKVAVPINQPITQTYEVPKSTPTLIESKRDYSKDFKLIKILQIANLLISFVMVVLWLVIIFAGKK